MSVAELEAIKSKIYLTNDEEFIIIQNCKGKSNQEIADMMCLSTRTVERRIHNLKAKMKGGGGID